MLGFGVCWARDGRLLESKRAQGSRFRVAGSGVGGFRF